MSGSEEQWYAVNKTGGIALSIAGAVSLLSCFVIPRFETDAHFITVLCTSVLVASLLISLGVTLSTKQVVGQ